MSQVSVEHIAIDEKGIARLVGRRLKVAHIVLDTQSGMTPAEVQAEYPGVGLAEIHAALTYYYDHQNEIDEQIRNADEAYESGLAKQRSDAKFQDFVSDLKHRGGRS